MGKANKVYVGIGIVVVLVVLAEMSISVFFANKYAEQHPGEETPLHMH